MMTIGYLIIAHESRGNCCVWCSCHIEHNPGAQSWSTSTENLNAGFGASYRILKGPMTYLCCSNQLRERADSHSDVSDLSISSENRP